MDNFHIDVTSEGDAALLQAFMLVFRHHSYAIGYSVQNGRLVFYWAEHKDAIKLPFKMDVRQAANFATDWLAQAEYSPEPDHDGDNEKAWRVFNEAWGHVGGQYQAFVAIEPVWAMYGK